MSQLLFVKNVKTFIVPDDESYSLCDPLTLQLDNMSTTLVYDRMFAKLVKYASTSAVLYIALVLNMLENNVIIPVRIVIVSILAC